MCLRRFFLTVCTGNRCEENILKNSGAPNAIGLNRPSNPNHPPFVGNFYSTTFGLNYTPCDHFVLRPEVRLDWFDGTGNPYDDGSSDFQSMAGFDAILSF